MRDDGGLDQGGGEEDLIRKVSLIAFADRSQEDTEVFDLSSGKYGAAFY